MATKRTNDAGLRALHATLSERRRPEDVAEAILELRGAALSAEERETLDVAARVSLSRQLWGWSSMAQSFAQVRGMERQVQRARELFESAYPLSLDLCRDPEAVLGFLDTVNREIGREENDVDFMFDRLSAPERKAAGIELSRRGYNKRFRLLARMEKKVYRMVREIQKRDFQMIGKSGLATVLPFEEFAADTDTACFIAYYTARANFRSQFMLDPQQRPFDEIAAMLFERAKAAGTPNWWAIAHVYPAKEVFANLSAAQAGELLGRWFKVLQDVAALLGETWHSIKDADPRNMIVRPGMDSSTWNTTAGAWNKARDNWMGLLYALGLESMLDACCPGKVMRLMAADLTYWHNAVRSGIDPNTEVWAELPKPWEVLLGEAVSCTRADVEAACRKVGMDPERSGWTAPKDRTRVAEFRPTPELVHGVAVSNPYLATVLKSIGAYSGKKLKENALV